jgi:hypothetical protein
VHAPRRDAAGAVSFLGGLTAVLLVGGALALALLLGAPSRVLALGEGGLDRLVRPTTTAAYGEPVDLAGRSGRPPVEIVADAPRRVVSRTPGQRATPGNVLVGAQVSIHNTGEVMWSSDQGLEVHALDSEGASYALRAQVTATRGARALRLPSSVLPGRTVRGVLVFEVPASADITRLTVTVGRGMTRSGAWSASDRG